MWYLDMIQIQIVISFYNSPLEMYKLFSKSHKKKHKDKSESGGSRYVLLMFCDLENSKVVQMAVVGPCTVQIWISAV